MSNLGKLQGSMPIARVGGNTQYEVHFIAILDTCSLLKG